VKTPAILAALCLLAGPPGATAGNAPPALPAHGGGTVALDDYARAPVLVIVVNARRLRHVQRWEESLRAELPDLQSMRIADVGQEPKPALTDVVRKLAKRVPPEVSIAIDLDNVWADRFGLDTREPCLLLFDADRQLVASWRGRARGAVVDEVLSGIQALQAPTESPGDG